MKNYTNYNPKINEPATDTADDVISSDPHKHGREQSRTDSRKHTTRPRQPERNPGCAKPQAQSVSIFSAQTWRDFAKSTPVRLIVGIVLACFGVYLTVSFVSYLSTCISDQSKVLNTAVGAAGKVANAGGEGGARLANFLINDTFGLGSIVILIWAFGMAFKMFEPRLHFKSVNFTIKCMVALISVSLIIGLLTIATDSAVNWGGLHGRYVNEFIINFFGWIGGVLLCIISASIFVVLCLADIIRWIMKLRQAHAKRRAEARKRREEELKKQRLTEEMHRQEMADAVKTGEAHKEETPEEEKGVNFSGDTDRITDADDITYGEIEEAPEGELNDDKSAPEGVKAENAGVATAAAGEPEEDAPEGNSMVVRVNHIGESDDEAPEDSQSPEQRAPYRFPPYDLLIDHNNGKPVTVNKEEQLENQDRIRKTLADFGIPIRSIEAVYGPTVTLYEIVPEKGVKIQKIRNLVDDIALSLSAIGVRIIAPIPGKGTVGIEVANKEPQTVSMRTVIRSHSFRSTHYRLPIALGSTIGGEVYIADLAKMPHLLVAGATGQGKSVGLNAIITSLLYSRRPDELKFVMVDPKMVEFSLYSKIEKYYLAKLPDEEDPIITDVNRVAATLNSLCVEMDNRYSLLKSAGVRKIEEYNKKFHDHQLNPKKGHRFLPYIVVIVDEFSDLIMQAGKEVEIPIARLGQKARAVGIHCIIATQRPSVHVITGLIKSNFPARIAFKVASGVDSKTILDTTGAQQLIGRGDMLISNNEMVRVQCAFVDTPEVEAVCDYISRQPYPQGAYLLPEPDETGDASAAGGSADMGSRDPLLEECARYIVGSGVASTSSLQRHFSLGYNRAGKIMDQMEHLGIVGPARGGKPRDLLVDPMTLEDILRSLS